MVNADKTKLMSECSLFEKRNSGRDYNAVKYSRSDYLRIKSIETFFFTTLGYICLFSLYMFYNYEKVVIDFLDFYEDEFYLRAAVVYLIVMLVAQIITFIKENGYYRRLSADAGMYKQRFDQIKKIDESDGNQL